LQYYVQAWLVSPPESGAKHLVNNFDIFLHSMALIIVSGARQKNVRQKNKACVCLLHFSVSHFSVWLVSMAETTTEAHSIKSNFLKHCIGERVCTKGRVKTPAGASSIHSPDKV
jgi:hypothetical protein